MKAVVAGIFQCFQRPGILLLAVWLLNPAIARSGSEVVRDPNSWDFAPLLYYDIVVRGTVDRVDTAQIDTGDIWLNPTPSGSPVPLVRVTLAADEVLRGPDVGSQWTFLCTGGAGEMANDFFVAGREVIVCGKYNGKLRTYYHPSVYGRYRREAGMWRSERTARGTRAFSDEQLRAKIRSVDIAQVAADADLVIEGSLVSYGFSEIVGPDSSSAELGTFEMKVERVLKGDYTAPAITVVAITSGLYSPPWRAHVPPPPVYAAGQRWLCFLKRNDIGWYPFAGTNGFLRVTEAGCLYDERVAFWHSVGDMEKAIDEAAKAGNGE